MSTVAAFCARHVSTTGVPGFGLVGGFAVKEIMIGSGGGGGGWITCIVTCCDTVPKLFEAVSVNRVSCVRTTSCVPARPTSPTMGEMLTLVAFSTSQSSVDVPPDGMVSGAPVNLMMRGAVPGVTLIPTPQVAQRPAALLAVSAA